jgi:signal transduction histidine kinase
MGEAGRRGATRVAVAISAACAVGEVIALLVGWARDMPVGLLENGAVINVVAGPTFPLLGALLLRPPAQSEQTSRPARQDRLAWLFVAFGALCAATLVVHVVVQAGLDHGVPLADAGAWVASWLWTGVPTGLLLLLLWFPTGEPPSRRWRLVPPAILAAWTGMWLSIAFHPGRMTDFEGRHDNPLGWRAADPVLSVVGSLGFLTLAVAGVATLASVAWRYHHGDREVRAQLRWLLTACCVIAVTMLLDGRGWVAPISITLNVMATVLLPVTLAVALTRRSGFGLSRVLVYGLLSTILLAGYLALVALSDALFGGRADRLATVLAAAVTAVGAAPLRARLQLAVNRLVYGDRGDPYAALSALGQRIADSPDDLLKEVARTVADALRAPFVAVVLGDDAEPSVAVGRPQGNEHVLDLSLRGERVGSLLVARRAPGSEYGERDLRLLNDLARHIAVAAHAAALARDLQRSRESLVLAREEERRRIRRDLHDGLGPALTGVAFGLDAVRNTVARDPEAAAAALTELRAEVQSSIGDVRRLVYELRPPVLDQLGLVSALEEYGARLNEGGGLDVRVTSSELPPLPAAVEVAAYRIASEALTNVVRHARARRSVVSLDVVGGSLLVEVVDDGVGVPPQRRAHLGVGLAAMAERAAELGGSCSVDRRDTGGTSVRALIPLRAMA